MKTLVIDCATEAFSVALFDGETPIAGEWRLLGRGHAEALVPAIAALPERGRAQRIAVALGPGSFTGVRVGLACARALALAWNARLVGYSTPDMLVAMARAEFGARAIGVATTGGHGEWFVQKFAADGLALTQVASLAPQDAISACEVDLVVGSQAEALVSLRGHGKPVPLWPDARKFTLLPAAAWVTDPAPLYGRPPDARLPQARS